MKYVEHIFRGEFMKMLRESFLAIAGTVLALTTSSIHADVNPQPSKPTEPNEPPLVITRVETPVSFNKDAVRDSLMAEMDRRNNTMIIDGDEEKEIDKKDKKDDKSDKKEKEKEKPIDEEDGDEWKIDRPRRRPTNTGDIRLDVIMNLAKQAWSVYVENRGKVDFRHSYANAVPKGITTSADLVGFSDLVFQSYNIRQPDWMGMTKFDLTFTLVFQHGGNFNGKGKYLETVSLIPTSIYAGWCEKVNAEVNHISTSNVGTKEDPIASAAVELNISSHCSVGIGAIKKTVIFQVRADNKPVRHSILARD